MTPVPATAEQPEAPLFTDGLGERVVAVDAATATCCRFSGCGRSCWRCRRSSSRCASAPRGSRISATPTTRACAASTAIPAGLAIVSDHVEGVRLSEMLRVAARARGCSSI